MTPPPYKCTDQIRNASRKGATLKNQNGKPATFTERLKKKKKTIKITS